jgi:two-component system, sensor histidine kinase PdtaS
MAGEATRASVHLQGRRDSVTDNWLARLLTVRHWLKRRPAIAWLVALGVFAACFFVRLMVAWAGLQGSPFAGFAPAIVLAPLIAGNAAGAAVAILSALGGWLFFLPAAPAGVHGGGGVFFGLYIVSVVIILAVMGLLDATLDRLIGERKRTEQLLQELYHRVGNNLQMASAFAQLQAREIASDEGRAALQATARRLSTMGSLHRRLHLHGNENLRAVDHLRALCGQMAETSGNVEVVWQTDTAGDAILSSDRLLTLSLIINEVVTNALKYAFPAGGKGTIRVSLVPVDDDLSLKVTDDGIGMFAGPADKSHLGTRIIKNLARQLGGEPEWSSGPGTTFALRFPK